MLLQRFIGLSAISMVTGACAAPPLPQDVTGSVTKDIVANVRCEAREGLRQTALDWLRHSNHSNRRVWRGYTGTQLANLLASDPSRWRTIQINEMEPYTRKYFSFYANSQIAYAFLLDLEEGNNDDIGVGFSRSFINKTASRLDKIGLSAASERQRMLKRSFNIVDTFSELAQLVPDSYCTAPKMVNLVYPMTGKLPIKDLISTYIHTNEFDHLGGAGTDPKSVFGTESQPAIPQMGDTITFSTKFSGGINPTYALGSPLGPGIQMVSASFSNTTYRKDRHEVGIVVSTSPDSAKLRPLDASVVGPLAFGRDALDANLRRTYLPPANRGQLTDARLQYGINTLAAQRQKNVDDAIIQLGNGLSRLAP